MTNQKLPVLLFVLAILLIPAGIGCFMNRPPDNVLGAIFLTGAPILALAALILWISRRRVSRAPEAIIQANSSFGINKKPFTKAFVCSGVLFAVIATILLVTEAQNVSYNLGGVTACCVFSALVTGAWARSSKKIWSWIRFAMTVIVLYFVFVFMAKAGRGQR